MDLVSTSYKRLFLRCIKNDAVARTVPLLTVLTEYATAQVKVTKTGVTLISSSGNGQSFGLLPNAGDGLTPVGYAEMLSDLLDRHDEAALALAEEGIPTPTVDQLYAKLMAYLQPVTEVYSNFAGVRI